MVQQQRAACCAVQRLACARHSCFGQWCIRWQQACGTTRGMQHYNPSHAYSDMQPACVAVLAAAVLLGSSCSTAAVVAAICSYICFASTEKDL
jgi:hypothetical protein